MTLLQYLYKHRVYVDQDVAEAINDIFWSR